MGAGIAQVSAVANHSVTLVDVNQAALDKGLALISSSLSRTAKKKHADDPNAQKTYVSNVLSRISTNTNLGAAVGKADVVIEAIVENIGLKHTLFKSIDASAPPHAILASNTSSLQIRDIVSAVPNRAPNFAGLHFFNPVPQMKLVEVISIPQTKPEVTKTLMEFCKGLGKVPVACKDTPGFIVNRLLVPYMMEAMRLVERGDATKEDVDTAMKLGAGYPMGPFELADYVGLDTCKFITQGWYSNGELKGDRLVEPVKSLEKLVESGKFGRKSGHGFFDYKGSKL